MHRKLAVVLVCLAGVAIWWTTRPRATAVVELASDLDRCRENLRQIYAGLVEYKTKFGRAPEGSGVAFFAELVSSGVRENTRLVLDRMTCPGPHAEPMPAGTSFKDLAALTPGSSAYAGRDQARAPLEKFPAGGTELQALVACDDAHGLNHDGAMNVLYSDGSVRTYVLADLIAAGTLPAGTTTIPVGPDSPLPELRNLRGD